MPRGSLSKQVLPRIQKLSPLCTTSLLFVSPGLPVLRGVSGGRSRIEFIVSPLPRRRHNESHFAAQSPERAFLAKPFFARAKNGVNSGRRSHKISVGEAKCYICRHKRAGALHHISQLALTASPQRGSQSKGRAARLDKRGEFRGTTKCEPV